MLKRIFSFCFLIYFFLSDTTANSHPVSDDFADLVEKLSPSVVNVFTVQKPKPANNQVPFDNIPPQFRDFFKNFPPGFPFGPQQQQPSPQDEQPQALGSGFVISSDGYIVTNNHVIEQANEIKVKFQDETELEAKLIGKDKLTDLALLKVESKKPLDFVKLADSDKARVGHSVIAIGNPFGLGGTVTSGKFGKTQRGWLGVRIQEITPDIAKSLGLKNEEGVLISMVNPGEPAEKGGLKAGDVILEFNGKKIKDVKSLQRTVADSAVESKATVKVWRNKKVKSFTVKLGELEKFSEADTSPEFNDENVKTNEVELDEVGLRFVGLTSETRSRYNLPKNLKGVVITAVKRDSFAAKAGLTVGSVISQISQVNVKTADEAKKIFDDASKKGLESVLLQVFQNDFSRFLILKIK
ncbi:MAG: PDZ domain-containing protein [Flavobacteriia bacterium]|nr:PDZ domain-containing protein [Flavobacteriia bacterium]